MAKRLTSLVIFLRWRQLIILIGIQHGLLARRFLFRRKRDGLGLDLHGTRVIALLECDARQRGQCGGL